MHFGSPLRPAAERPGSRQVYIIVQIPNATSSRVQAELVERWEALDGRRVHPRDDTERGRGWRPEPASWPPF